MWSLFFIVFLALSFVGIFINNDIVWIMGLLFQVCTVVLRVFKDEH